MPVKFDQYDVSGQSGADDTLFQAATDSLKRNKVGLKGAWPFHTCWLTRGQA